MNSVNLVGNVATSVKSGNGSATAMLAVHRIFKSSDGVEADFVPIVAFGKMAEVLSNYVSKGTRIGISGHIHTGQYEKDGRTEYTYQIVAEHIYLLSSKPHNGASKDASPKLSDATFTSLSPKIKDSDLPF